MSNLYILAGQILLSCFIFLSVDVFLSGFGGDTVRVSVINQFNKLLQSGGAGQAPFKGKQGTAVNTDQIGIRRVNSSSFRGPVPPQRMHSSSSFSFLFFLFFIFCNPVKPNMFWLYTGCLD